MITDFGMCGEDWDREFIIYSKSFTYISIFSTDDMHVNFFLSTLSSDLSVIFFVRELLLQV